MTLTNKNALTKRNEKNFEKATTLAEAFINKMAQKKKGDE